MCILEFVAWSLMSFPKRNKFLQHSHSAKKVLATYRKTSYLYCISSRRSSTPHARTNDAPPPLPVCNRRHLVWPPFMRTYYLFIHLIPFPFPSLTISRLFSFLLVSEVKFHQISIKKIPMVSIYRTFIHKTI